MASRAGTEAGGGQVKIPRRPAARVNLTSGIYGRLAYRSPGQLDAVRVQAGLVRGAQPS